MKSDQSKTIASDKKEASSKITNKKSKAEKNNVSFRKVKELRDVTGAGMQDCKNALKENDNNIEKSIEYLRKKGVLKAAKAQEMQLKV